MDERFPAIAASRKHAIMGLQKSAPRQLEEMLEAEARLRTSGQKAFLGIAKAILSDATKDVSI